MADQARVAFQGVVFLEGKKVVGAKFLELNFFFSHSFFTLSVASFAAFNFSGDIVPMREDGVGEGGGRGRIVVHPQIRPRTLRISPQMSPRPLKISPQLSPPNF